MSKYTTEVRFICETSAGLEHSEGYKSINQIITDSMDKVFDFDFPIFDETYRPVLERKILKHYYTREICAETVGLWKHFLDMRLNEIMPYYNKLYESELLQFNPFYDVDLTTDRKTDGERNANGERVNSGTDSNERISQDSGTESRNIQSEDGGTESGSKSILDGGTEGLSRTVTDSGRDTGTKTSRDGGTQGESGSDVNKNTRWDIYSDTPQGALTNVNNETYLTNARKIIDDGTGSTHSSTTTFGKTVTENDTMDYGKVETTGATTTFGKTVSETDSTTFGKTNDTTEGVTFGKRNVTNDNGQHRNTETSEDKITTTEDYLQHVIGKSGGRSYAQLLVEYRETFLNIDMLIIEDLSDLFMQLW